MSSNMRTFAESPAVPSSKRNPSPLMVLAPLLILIFAAEMIAMLVLNYVRLSTYLLDSLLDGIIMTTLILPGLYFLQLKPLFNQIEERSRAEQAFRTSDGLLRKVLNLMPVGVFITDETGNIVHANPAGHQLWAEAPYVGMEMYSEYKGWFANTKKRIEADEWAGARAIRRCETSLNEEIEIETFDGQRKTILNSAVPIFDEQNRVQGAIIVNQDITKLREEEKALIQTSELMERFFLSTTTLIAYMDRDFNFVRVNDTYARSGGHTADYYPGKNHFDLYPNEENQAIFQRVVETGEPFSVLEKPFEYPEHPEWGVTYWDWSLQAVRGVDGEIEGVVLSLVDVTERKRAEIQLEQQNQNLLLLSIAEHRQRELAEGLVNAVITLNKSLELDQVLCSILEQIRKIIPFRGAAIVLLEGRTLRVASFLGFEGYPESQLALGDVHSLDDYPVIQQVCSTLEPLVINSVNLYPGWKVAPGTDWVGSYVAVPLLTGGDMFGIINLVSELTDAFTQEALNRVLAFAPPAALALRNARLFAAESNARKATETLSAAAQALTQTLDLEQVVHILLEHLHNAVPSDVDGVALLRDEAGLSVITAHGYDQWENQQELPSLPVVRITDSVLQKMKEDRKSLVIPRPVSPLSPDGSSYYDQINLWLIVPIIASDNVIGLVGLGKAGDGSFSQEQAEWAEALVGQAAVAIQNAWLFEQVRSSSERLQSLAHKLVEIQENERYFIARELHDDAGQALSSLKLSLGMLEQDPDCPPQMQHRLLNLKGLADGVLENLHRLAMDLRPAALDHLGLVAALEQYANSLSSSQFSVQFKAVGFTGERLYPDLEVSLYRITQEALTNVIRHAQASQVGILLKRDGGKVMLFIEDDGIGFDPDKNQKTGRLGLVGIRERAEMFGGSLTIESSSGTGTSIIVEVPDASAYPYRG